MPSFHFARCTAIAALLAVHGIGQAQSPAPRAEPVRSLNAAPAQSYYGSPDRMEVVDPDKKLAAGDEVTVEIEQDREGGFAKVVTAAGELDVPPCGRIKVAGKTTAEASSDIKRALERDYYYVATVKLSIDRVSRSAVKSGQIQLAGEVKMQGTLDLVAGEKLFLSQAILKGGGFGTFGDDRKVQVTRLDGKKLIIDVKELLKSGNREKDILLQDGDRVYVPRVFGKF